MKKAISNLMAATVLVLFAMLNAGCPIGLEYPIGNPNKEKLDARLLGTWVSQTTDSEIKRVKVSKKDDNTYAVEVLERGEMYALETDKLNAWVTHFNGESFLYAMPDDPNDQKYYHYVYSFEGSKLVMNDMSLLVGGVDAVTSQETLRTEVAESMKKPDFLANKIEFTKE